MYVFADLGHELLHLRRVHHLLNLSHPIACRRKGQEDDRLHIPLPKRRIALGRAVNRRLILLRIMQDIVDRELRSTQFHIISKKVYRIGLQELSDLVIGYCTHEDGEDMLDFGSATGGNTH